MIIELYSIPGAGKTTVIKSITGGKATSYSNKRLIMNLILNSAKKAIVYTPLASSYKYKIKKTVSKEHQINAVFFQRTFSEHLNSIVLVACGYKHTNKRVYMDEGLIHRIVSLAVNYNFSDDELIKTIDIFEKTISKIKCFYLDVPVDECYKSIKKRNRHEGGMDELGDSELYKFLSQYEHYCSLINTHYSHTCITRNNFDLLRSI